MRPFAKPAAALTVLLLLTQSHASADIFQWEWVDPSDHSKDKQQSANLTGSGADLTAAPDATYWDLDLNNAFLLDARFTRSTFGQVIAASSLMSRSNLELSQQFNTSFANAELSNSNFGHSTIFGSGFQNADLTSANFSSAFFDSTDFHNANAPGAKFRNGSIFQTDFSNANLAGADFTGARFFGAQFAGADLTDADFSGANFLSVYNMDPTPFYSSKNYQQNNFAKLSFSYSDLNDWNFAGKDLATTEFLQCRFFDSDFTDAKINHANLDFSSLSTNQLYSTASYKNHDLSNTRFWLAPSPDGTVDLSGQNLNHSSIELPLWETNLTGADVRYARLATNLTSFASLPQIASTSSYPNKDLRGLEVTIMDPDFQVARNVNFAGFDLRDSAIYIDYASSDLSDALIEGASFNYNFHKEALYSTASYKAKNLTGVVFYHVPINGWDFTDQDITAADFTTSDLSKAQLESTVSFQNRDLHGVGLGRADYTNADFSGFDLTGAQFVDSTLSGANFQNAQIQGAKFVNTLTYEQLASTKSYQDGDLTGLQLFNSPSSVDFTGQNLAGAIIINRDLGGGVFRNAVVTSGELDFQSGRLDLELIREPPHR